MRGGVENQGEYAVLEYRIIKIYAEGTFQTKKELLPDVLRSVAPEFECIDQMYEAGILRGNIKDAAGDVEWLFLVCHCFDLAHRNMQYCIHPHDVRYGLDYSIDYNFQPKPHDFLLMRSPNTQAVFLHNLSNKKTICFYDSPRILFEASGHMCGNSLAVSLWDNHPNVISMAYSFLKNNLCLICMQLAEEKPKQINLSMDSLCLKNDPTLAYEFLVILME